MKLMKAILAFAVLVSGIVATGAAQAHHGWRGHSHWRFGISVGAPAYWYYPGPGYYYPPPYYYYPPYYPDYYYPPAGGAPEDTEYVERDSAPAPRRQAGSDWYYCPESNGYYPYIKQCPGGWQRVPPKPPAGPGGSER